MNTKSILRRAMLDSDHWVIELDYIDAQGQVSHRVISPIRFVGSDRVLALCLCREAPRQFQLSRCESVRLVPSAEVLMPIAMTSLAPGVEPISAASFSHQQPCLV